MIHWRREGEPVEPGLSIWRWQEQSLGFILSLDRWHIYFRYNKKYGKIFWSWERTEPRAWRLLKGKHE